MQRTIKRIFIPEPDLAAGATAAGALGAEAGFTPPAAGVRHCGQNAKFAPMGAPQFLQKLLICAHHPGTAVAAAVYLLKCSARTYQNSGTIGKRGR
jgi:hypothetical protein